MVNRVTLNEASLKQWQEENLEHLRYEYDLKPGDLVLDIGSYQREFANEIIKRYGCSVECFDALDNRAAWLLDGAIILGGAYYYSSIYEPGRNVYKCVDIAPFLEKEIALCKINIEGGEYTILPYIFEKGLQRNIRHLQVQFHEIQAIKYEKEYELIAEALSETHILHWRYPFCWESWRRK